MKNDLHPDHRLRSVPVTTVWLINPDGDWEDIPSNEWERIDDLLDAGWREVPDTDTKYVRGY